MSVKNISFLFALTGVLMLTIAGYYLENVICNFGDTYYVTNAISFGFIVLVFYLVCALIYHFIRKKSIYILAVLNLIFVTLFVLNLMFTEAIFETIPSGKYLEHPILLDITLKTPMVMLVVFLTGNLFLLINIITAVVRHFRHKCST